MTTSIAAPEKAGSDPPSSLMDEVALLKAKLATRDAEASKHASESAELRQKVTDLERAVAVKTKQLAAQDEQLAASTAKIQSQHALVESMLSVDPSAQAAAEADAAEARAEAAQSQKRCARLLELCERAGLPVPDKSTGADAAYEAALKLAFEQHVQSAAEKLALTLRGKLKAEADAVKDAKRVVECFQLLSGASEFQLSDDGSNYAVTIRNEINSSKVVFRIGWDDVFVEYEPVELTIAAGDTPEFLMDKIEFKHNQAPIFFSKMLNAVFVEQATS